MSSLRRSLLLAVLACASAFRTGASPRVIQRPLAAASKLQMAAPKLQNGVAAAAVALALSMGTPNFVSASMQPPAVVQKYGSSMIADEVSDAQKKFLEERQKMRTKYEEGEIKGNYKSADDVQDKKITYTSVVIGLIVIAFVAPMIQFFYYTGGD